MTQPLVFLVRPQQVDTLMEAAPDLLSAARLISLDLDVSARLAMLGYSSTAMTDVLPADVIHRLRLEAVRLSETWFLPYQDLFTDDGFVLPYLDRFAMAWCFTEALIARELFRRCAADAHEIVIVDSPRKLTVWGAAPPDAANAVWRWMGAKTLTPDPSPSGRGEKAPLPLNQFSLQRFWKSYFGVKRSSYAASDSPLPEGEGLGVRVFLKTSNRIVSLASNWLLNPLLRDAIRGREYAALMVVYYLEASRYSAIAGTLERAFGDRFAKMTTDYVHRAETGGTVWNPMPTLRPYWTARRVGEGMRRAFETWKAQPYQGDYPELFANPHLHFKFRHFITERFPRAAQTAADTLFTLRRLHPKTIIVTSVAIHHQPQIIAAAGRLGIPVMTVPHSGIPTAPEITLTGERGIVWTQDFIDWWGRGGEAKSEGAAAGFGINSNQLVMVGLPQEIVLHGYEQQAVQPSTSGKKTILALLSAATLDTLAHGDMAAHWDTLKALANVPEHLRESIRLIFKLHPGADYQYFYEQVRQSSPAPDAIEIVKNASLLDLVREADLSVSVNIPTSAYLLPLEAGKPLLHVQTIVLPGIRFALGGWQGASVIRQPDLIWSTLESALLDAAAILEDNRRFRAYLSPDMGEPLDNIITTLAEMLNRSQSASDSPSPCMGRGLGGGV
jgi:hypothetical protein